MKTTEDDLDQMHERDLCDVFKREVCGWSYSIEYGRWYCGEHPLMDSRPMTYPALCIEDCLPWLEKMPSYTLAHSSEGWVCSCAPLHSSHSELSLAHAVCLALIRAKRQEKK